MHGLGNHPSKKRNLMIPFIIVIRRSQCNFKSACAPMSNITSCLPRMTACTISGNRSLEIKRSQITDHRKLHSLGKLRAQLVTQLHCSCHSSWPSGTRQYIKVQMIRFQNLSESQGTRPLSKISLNLSKLSAVTLTLTLTETEPQSDSWSRAHMPETATTV